MNLCPARSGPDWKIDAEVWGTSMQPGPISMATNSSAQVSRMGQWLLLSLRVNAQLPPLFSPASLGLSQSNKNIPIRR